MMDPSPMGNGRRNRRRPAGGRGNGAAAGNEGQGNGLRSRRRRRKRGRPGFDGSGRTQLDRMALEPVRDSSSVLGSRVPQKQRREIAEGPPDAFSLFASYHLGVTPDDGYQKPSLGETARRYGVPPEQIQQLLAEYAIDHESISKVDFDLEGARLDIRVAPEGISRIELARQHYESYLESVDAG